MTPRWKEGEMTESKLPEVGSEKLEWCPHGYLLPEINGCYKCAEARIKTLEAALQLLSNDEWWFIPLPKSKPDDVQKYDTKHVVEAQNIARAALTGGKEE